MRVEEKDKITIKIISKKYLNSKTKLSGSLANVSNEASKIVQGEHHCHCKYRQIMIADVA